MEVSKEAMAIAEILDNKKASDIIILKVDDLTIISDYFVIASAGSTTLVQTLSDEVQMKMKERFGVVPLRVEGEREGRWVVIDYGVVLVHLFHKDERDFYQLERLWKSEDNYLDYSAHKKEEAESYS